jgi:GNAT superfamily N-acetyltransferase
VSVGWSCLSDVTTFRRPFLSSAAFFFWKVAETRKKPMSVEQLENAGALARRLGLDLEGDDGKGASDLVSLSSSPRDSLVSGLVARLAKDPDAAGEGAFFLCYCEDFAGRSVPTAACLQTNPEQASPTPVVVWRPRAADDGVQLTQDETETLPASPTALQKSSERGVRALAEAVGRNPVWCTRAWTVVGPTSVAEQFAEAWVLAVFAGDPQAPAAGGAAVRGLLCADAEALRQPQVEMQMLLHACFPETLVRNPAPPGKSPSRGCMRPASWEDEDERALLCRWHVQFEEDVWADSDARKGDLKKAEQNLRPRVKAGHLFLWCTDDGTPVCMAGFNRHTETGVSVGPVFTPKEHRGRGFASALVSEMAAVAFTTSDPAVGGSPRHWAALFTDEQNPTSNKVYATCGFAPVLPFRHLVLQRQSQP